jgi:hypothetical protein
MRNGESVRVQHMAYEVDTSSSAKMEEIYAARSAGPPAGSTDQQKQIHFFHFLVDHMFDIFQYQSQNGRLTAAADLVTVFAVPEFYFKDRQNLPFDQAVYTDGKTYLTNKFNGLQNLLVFAGSTWWWEQMVGPDGMPNAAIHNSAPILWNGALACEWNKRFLSRLDGLGNPDANWGPATHWDQKIESASPLYDGSPSPIFTITVNGVSVSFGVEVCLDHYKQTLKGFSDGHLDAHVLICAGMYAIPQALACRVGGAFLRCEGGRGFGGVRSNAGVRTGLAVPADAASATYDSVQNRAKNPDEQVRIYNALTLTGPS